MLFRSKAKYLEQETSRGTLEYARRMKSVLDPKGILNPGKILSLQDLG